MIWTVDNSSFSESDDADDDESEDDPDDDALVSESEEEFERRRGSFRPIDFTAWICPVSCLITSWFFLRGFLESSSLPPSVLLLSSLFRISS